jgi:hypothetical protein
VDTKTFIRSRSQQETHNQAFATRQQLSHSSRRLQLSGIGAFDSLLRGGGIGVALEVHADSSTRLLHFLVGSDVGKEGLQRRVAVQGICLQAHLGYENERKKRKNKESKCKEKQMKKFKKVENRRKDSKLRTRISNAT